MHVHHVHHSSRAVEVFYHVFAQVCYELTVGFNFNSMSTVINLIANLKS